jgi:hypothetical protein
MRRASIFSILLSGILILAAAAAPALGGQPNEASEWWNQPYPQRFDVEQLPNSPDFIRVDGNRFVDEAGEAVVFDGLSIADPDKLDRQDRWGRAIFEEVAGWGADVVRVPVHPVAWRARGKDGYFALLDQAVVWANELGMYLMIDWHTIGNLQSGLYQHPMYDTTKQETREFWRSVAARYRGVSTIAFYELFNEPTTYNGQLGDADWEEWKRLNEELIRIVFAHDRQVVPLVAGFNWAYDLRPVAKAPIEAEGIGYVSHPYPQKVVPPYEEKWEQDFGFVADRYPVFVTEFGFTRPGNRDAHVPVTTEDDYGSIILEYFARKGISWAAWCFDPDWGAHLIDDWEYTPTESGALFRSAMSERE